ncbi:MAG: hypothetical protein NWQ09_04760 [Nonlabens sp.]|nr:hypothetical protein [Nonlabens sp.]
MKYALQILMLTLLLGSCKNDNQIPKDDISALSTETSENQEIEMPEEDDDSPVLVESVLHVILEENDLGNLQMGSQISILKNTELKTGDSLNLVTIETGEKKVKAYRFSRNGVKLIDFYLINNRIKKVEILDGRAVPQGMIAPGSSLRDLNRLDDKLMPRGSAAASEVTVRTNNIIYTLDARHPIDEPIDLYPSTPITKITFLK